MYRILITPSAKKEAKKLPKNVRIASVESVQKLKSNPYLGEKLSGSLNFLYSFHFKVGGKDYRLAYTFDNKNKIIIVHLIQIRENFYLKLKRLFK
ncbi:MAG: type II toxin-antitoxin system RelE/ParE family toxin [Patescibacteria group bacterium]